MSAHRPTIAVVGAGAGGVLAALHLLDSPGPSARLLLVERSDKTGRGVAFSTDHRSHLLNVPAASMSAFERDPGHFVRWLGAKGSLNAQDDFVPRRLFGEYLGETLLSWAHLHQDDLLEIARDELVDVDTTDAGPTLVFSGRQPISVDVVVLATGILPARWPRDLGTWQDNERCISDPWKPDVLDQVGPADTVTLLGTGLTAVDVLLALAEKGHHGSIRAISRHGLLPRGHLSGPQDSATTGTSPLELGSLELGDRRTRLLLHRFRDAVAQEQARGGDWRPIVDLLRPKAQEIWQSLPTEEQLRFRSHVERFWNVHRHRMAPAVAEQVDQLRGSGIFRPLAGRILALEPSPTGLQLQVKLPSKQRPYRWETDWLVNCTGPGTFAFTDDQVLARNLRRRGLARPGHLDTGIDTDAGGRVIAASGRPSEWMWALGSLRQGQLLESTAVPEIRSQAHEIASDVRRYLAGKASGLASSADDHGPDGDRLIVHVA
jgi:uncharacterized NAD(P)/FAD-binding protein YdhS